MAATGTPTTNIGLRRPQGTDPASVDDINYNSEVIDEKMGAVGNTSVQAQLDALNSKIGNTAYADHTSKTAYQLPLTGFETGNYWTAFMYIQTGASAYGIYLVFLNTSDAVFVTKIAGTSDISFSGARSGNAINLTASSTVWGGIRAMTMN